MALGFIKKVFTFGRDKAPAQDSAAEDGAREALTPEELAALQSESEPHTRDEELAVSPVDPVAALEMDTAGGPASDDLGDADLAEEDDAPLLPAADMLPGEMGMVPLSLLEAEAEAESLEGEVPPSALSGISPARGETDLGLAPSPLSDAEPPAIDSELDTGLDASADTSATEAAPTEIILPKGFATRVEDVPVAVVARPKLTWFQRLREGLSRTSSQLTGQITALFTKRKLDEATLEELEDLLIQADLGVETAMRIADTLSSERYGKDVSGEDVSRIMATEITKVLKPVAKPLALDLNHKPHVILVVGVNGTGKTTTIGKLAAKLSGSGLKVMLAAGDTFRAAAIEQLKIWADRTKSEFIGTKLGADAAGLAYDAFEQARQKKCDVLIIDTAGRLQNKAELMAELEKIVRVLGKLDPDAPHTVLQTLDATTGQNAMNQVEIFRNVAGVSGLIMTKLDGTARGGILVAIAAKHKLPVYFIGVGEGVEDLEPFEAEDFASAIAGLTH
jgi:fused signal recognition particle receptor